MAKTAVFSPNTASQPPRLRHTFWWYLKWFFIVLQLLVFCGIVVAACIGKGLYDELQKVVPDLRVLLAKNRAEPTRVYAADGSLLAEFNTDRRQWVAIDQLKVWRNRGGKMVEEPSRLIAATLSIEDARFYRHPGVDAKRIAGALVANLKAGRIKQGGSTITEQLVDNVYLDMQRNFQTRLNSTMISLQLERKLSKDEILEAYLNTIYYGNRAYGCEAAAQTYFGKSAKNLTIAEAAMIAGLPQSPSSHDPFKHFDNATKRQRVVLREMLQNRFINWGQYQEALKDKDVERTVKKQRAVIAEERSRIPRWRSPYFVSYVRQYLQKQYGYNLDEPGLKVYTTLDPKLQRIAERELEGAVARRGRTLQGAMVVIDPWTGHVVSMVGGRDYYNKQMNGQFNRAVQGKRQPGSTMKPYIYAAAMETGMTPDSVMIDSPYFVCGDSECPPGKRNKREGGHEIRNYTRSHSGAMTIRSAMGQSNNVVATKVLLKVGIQNVIQKSHLMGLQSSLRPYPTLALGTSEVSLLEHVSAFGVFATKGLRAEPTPVFRVENYLGDVLLEQPMPVRGARVLSPIAANNMYQMLRYVVTNGTGRTVQISGVDLIGKTGTTSSNKDIWFMGASPQLVAGVWMGYDQPKPLGGNSAGGRWCGPVFRDFMREALPIWKKRKPIEKLVEDARATAQQRYLAKQYRQYIRVRLCSESGLLATKECPQTAIEVFSAAGGAPTQSCTIHRSNNPNPRDLNSPPSTSRPGDFGHDPVRDGDVDLNAQPDADTSPRVDPNVAAQREYQRELQLEDQALQTGADQPVRNQNAGGSSSAPRTQDSTGEGIINLDQEDSPVPQPQTLDDFGNQAPARRGNR